MRFDNCESEVGGLVMSCDVMGVCMHGGIF